VERQTSVFFKENPLFSTITYLTDNFSENVVVSKSKFERTVFELIKDKRFMFINLECTESTVN
jgi:hypothetical protein